MESFSLSKVLITDIHTSIQHHPSILHHDPEQGIIFAEGTVDVYASFLPDLRQKNSGNYLKIMHKLTPTCKKCPF